MHPFEYLIHCIDALRQFLMCHADVSPRYHGRVSPEITAENPHGGFGQERMCRSWDQLVDFAIENSACYARMEGGPSHPEIDNYKHCPDGQILWDA